MVQQRKHKKVLKNVEGYRDGCGKTTETRYVSGNVQARQDLERHKKTHPYLTVMRLLGTAL